MRRAQDLTREELEEFVTGVVDVLFLKDGELTPDKGWSADTPDEVADVVDRFGLRPQS
jgi:hypothetical protein